MTELTLVECVRTCIWDSMLITPILDRAYETLSCKIPHPLSNRVDTSTGVDTPPKFFEALDSGSMDKIRSSPELIASPDSTDSSLMKSAWKPGHSSYCDHSAQWPKEAEVLLKRTSPIAKSPLLSLHARFMPTPRNTTQDLRHKDGSIMPVNVNRLRSTGNGLTSNKDPRMTPHETPANKSMVDPKILHRRTLLVTVAESICCEQGPSAAADVHLINTHLYHLAYVLDVKSPSFTSTVVRISQAGQPTVYKPNWEFSLTLLQCGQILQDVATEILKFYLITDLDPYKYDPGRILAVHLDAGVSSGAKAAQLAALALQRLHTGLKIIAQLQSVNKNESVAYTTNSMAQNNVIDAIKGPPRGTSPLAAYSPQDRGLAWRHLEAQTPGTQVSDEGTQLP
jgi:hypothetical protein